MTKKILICTHGRFGEALLKSAEMILGEVKDVKAFSLLPGMEPADYRSLIREYMDEQEESDFFALTDLYGGTPTNTMATFLKDTVLEIVTGVNLTMLMEVIMERETLSNEGLKRCALAALKSSGYDVRAELEDILHRKGD